MTEPIFDKSGKCLLENEGQALAFLGGLRDVVACRAAQSETVHPRRLPDGLLEVTLRDQEEPVLLLVELCTYPESRVAKQMYDDIQLVEQARGLLPEALALVLCPKGNAKVPRSLDRRSRLGLTGSGVSWTVLELWTLDAETMLECPDVGIVPWVPLMKFDGPPERLFRRCRERIEKEGGSRREGLLVVTRSLASLRVVEPALLNLFLRSESMIETPMFREFGEKVRADSRREDILSFLQERGLGELSGDAKARLAGLAGIEPLRALLFYASICPTLAAFVERLNAVTTTPPAPTSSRRKRKS